MNTKDERDLALQELIGACQMALEWINNLVDQVGTIPVLDAMPNNWGGRLRMQEAIKLAKSLLE